MTNIDAPFPSERWFSELIARAMSDGPLMERLGIADLRLGVEILDSHGTPTLFGIVLDGYDIEAVGEVSETEFEPEVVVSGSIDTWREMVASIETHGRADSTHTLNSLAIVGAPLCIRAADPMGNDKFFRYMGTLQAIFDSAGSPAVAASGR